MVHYPESFPFESVQFLVPLVRNGQLMARKAEAAEHAWNVVGYALSQTIGHEHVVGMALPEGGINPDDYSTIEDEKVLHALETMAHEASGPQAVGAAGFPAFEWKNILKWALTIFLKLAVG
jgi:hypothetical protein